ncbi:hypothetical protein ACLESD_05670 [Pyxidicoccus sp. 3LFB2]
MLSVTAACRRAPPPLVPTATRTPPVRLDFQPPVDRVLTESVRAIRVVERGGVPVREVAELTTETRFTPAEGGWLLAQVVPRSRLMRGGDGSAATQGSREGEGSGARDGSSGEARVLLDGSPQGRPVQGAQAGSAVGTQACSAQDPQARSTVGAQPRSAQGTQDTAVSGTQAGSEQGTQGGTRGTQTAEQDAWARTADGTEVDTWVDDVLVRFTLRVRLAADGTFVKLVSPEAALEALRQVVPAGTDTAALERFFSPEVLEARTRREWEARYSGLFQRNLSEGQRIWSVDVLPVGDVQVAYVLERTVQGTRDTKYGDALVLSLRCLDALPAEAPADLTEAWETAGKPALTPGVKCVGEQLVARGRFVPVSRELTVKATVAGEAWTLTTESRAQALQEEAR